MIHPPGHCPRGALNALHHSAMSGVAGRVSNLLSKGSIGIDDTCCAGGRTPLMCAAERGHSRVIKILLEAGADVTAVCDGGVTALHISAKHGHLPVTNLLIKAGADLEAGDIEGYTPLHIAAQVGRHRVMEALVEAGANVDHTLPDGATPMYLAAETGHLGAVKVLLRFNADAQIETEGGCTPLEVATEKGYIELVHELVTTTKLDGCGGSTRGAFALHLAAQAGHVPIMQIMYSAGARDTEGDALCAAVSYGGQQAMQFLLERPEVFKTGCTCGASYVNHACKKNGMPPLVCCLTESALKRGSRRTMHRLIEAGADTAATYSGHDGDTSVGYTLLEMVNAKISAHYLTHGIGDDSNTVRGLHGLRRLLMTEEAIHALSWGWTSAPNQALPARKKATTLLPLMMRERQETKSRVVLRALHR